MAMRVGIFGGGVVGGGVYEIVKKYMKDGKFRMIGANIEIAKICVRDLNKPRDFQCSSGTTLVTDYNEILGDSSITCVVELMGGVTHAKDVVFAAINAGKNVVTANKALIAQFLPEIKTLLANKPDVKFCYEAAVCGGIPVIHALHSDFLGDDITKVMGIMNGTTNFMLCKMEDEGADYAAVLKEAQDLGFAEADPTADVEGYDVQAKIAILAKLSYGKTIDVTTVPIKGISSITSVDFEYAALLNSSIKLIGAASKNPDGSIAVYVSPMVVPRTSPFATAKGPGNMVVINSNNNTQSTMAGPGAGRWPTANSVINDMIRLCKKQECDPFPLEYPDIVINNDYKACFYVRIHCKDGLGIIKAVGDAAEASKVSINSVLQNPITDPSNVDFVVTTETCQLSQVTDFAARCAKMPFASGSPLFMPIL